VYALPLILGVSIGSVTFVIIFVVIFIWTEMKRKKSVFKEDLIAEDKLLKEEFPAHKKFSLQQHLKSTEGGLLPGIKTVEENQEFYIEPPKVFEE